MAKDKILLAKAKVTMLLRVTDGDTFYCNLGELRPIVGSNIGVRIRGIDAPELRAVDPQEKLKALRAKSACVKMLWDADQIILKNVSRGKYFRLIADVYCDGVNLAGYLLSQKLVTRY